MYKEIKKVNEFLKSYKIEKLFLWNFRFFGIFDF
jgi:hypothetical protein